MELQDTVLDTIKMDDVAREAMKCLSSLDVSPMTWTIEKPGPDSSIPLLFYNGCLYIPDDLELRRQIVKDHHNTLMAGHPGVLATCWSIRTSYWWPGLSLFVHNYVKGCTVCQQFKVNMRLSKPSLVPIRLLSS